MKIKEINYKNYGRCVEISNDIVKLIVTVDVGPRIINYSFLNGENIMWEDIDRRVFNEGVSDTFGSPWYIYGGHRLWTSPEGHPRSYYADNNPVEYEINGNSVRFVQEVQKANGYQCEFTVTLTENSSEVTVNHKVTNRGLWEVELAPWALTVLSQGGVEIIPQPIADTGLLGNRLLALWPYTKLTDKRVIWGDRYIQLRQDPDAPDAFKFGINSEHGFTMYFNHGDLFIKKFDVKENGNYPDGGMSFETYTCANFLEMESLGELKKIKPGESTCHSEKWTLYKCEAPEAFDEKNIDGLVKKFI